MHCRKNFLDLMDEERGRLADALNHIHELGIIEEHAHHHAEYFFKGIHFGPAFLPWHRHMLLMVEMALQTFDSRVMLPFWDWTRSDDSQDLDVEPWLSFFGGRAGKGQFGTWDFSRASSPSGSLPSTNEVQGKIQNAGSFADFRALECGIHSAPHIWVGGTMAGAESPLDPLFYLHHGNIDRVWALWQLNHAALTQYTLDSDGSCDSVDEAFVDLNNPMVGGATPASMLDHEALGYSYATDNRLPTALITGDSTEVVLQTPMVIFNDVPEGDTTLRAALFSITGCSALSFEVPSGPGAPFSLYAPGPYPYPQSPGLPTEELRIWLSYTGRSPGSVDITTMTVIARNMFGDEIARFDNIPIMANSVRRPKVSIAMVLDESGSMLYDAGYGRTRLEVLRYAANTLIDQLFDDNGIAMVSFANTADTVLDLQTAGDLTSSVRSDAHAQIAAHGPPDIYQHTSIGAGLQAAANLYAGSPLSPSFDTRSTLVFTDGFEDRAPWIAQVSSLISDRVYAVGIANAANVANDTLRALADGTGGYMLVTGAIPQDDEFLLEKFFIQILAGVTNRDIVRDPDGWLVPGSISRVPFSIARSDIAFDAVALSRAPHYVLLGLETPNGTVVNQGQVAPGQFRLGTSSGAFRITLPLVINGKGHWEGEWQLLLALAGFEGVKVAAAVGTGFSQAAALKYHAIIHARSNLRLRAAIAQSGVSPGSQMSLRATLTEYGQPLPTHPEVVATVTRPDWTVGTLTFAEVAESEYEAAMPATQQGVYRFLVRASGFSGRGNRFTREQLLTGLTGRQPEQPPNVGGAGSDTICEILECLLRSGAISEGLLRRLRELGLDPTRLMRCLHCREKSPPVIQ